jgi:hypothetical protein
MCTPATLGRNGSGRVPAGTTLSTLDDRQVRLLQQARRGAHGNALASGRPAGICHRPGELPGGGGDARSISFNARTYLRN